MVEHRLRRSRLVAEMDFGDEAGMRSTATVRWARGIGTATLLLIIERPQQTMLTPYHNHDPPWLSSFLGDESMRGKECKNVYTESTAKSPAKQYDCAEHQETASALSG
jgi:hypothetical protein